MPHDHAAIIRDLASRIVAAIAHAPDQVTDNGILLTWSTAPDGIPRGLFYVIGEAPLGLVKRLVACMADAEAMDRASGN